MAVQMEVDTLDYYAQLPYAITIKPDSCDGKLCYMASHPELYGCMAQGTTPEEALKNLEAARKDYIATLIAEGIEVPLPHVSSTV